eukprot:TRINITY_DN562_c0_g1_i7.p2 TRINITY_DN562_c0_g1~~TRINITY_DN562_c0_g1_i7.p2  ORF type:complete len:185 (+),score=51.08 TRINITY_DN562_c0_g1_i7:129-683(+)
MASVNYKISKAKGQSVTELEERIAQALIDLEASSTELKPELRELSISGAKEVDLPGGKSAIVVFVPYRLLTKYHKVQTRLVRELEKKFSGKHMVILAQRRVFPAERKGGRLAPQKRPARAPSPLSTRRSSRTWSSPPTLSASGHGTRRTARGCSRCTLTPRSRPTRSTRLRRLRRCTRSSLGRM